MRVAVTGISGRFGRRVGHRLQRRHEVVGIDPRACASLPKSIDHRQVDLRRRPAEDVFRKGHFDAVVHLGVVHNFRIPADKLFARNVIGTETLLRYVRQYGVKKFVVLSSGNVYGPMPSNSSFISEDAPLMASQRFPAVRTLVAVDRTVQSFFWREPDIETVLLRPSHIVGPHVRNAPSNYLRKSVLPTVMGFDPMVQLIHEDDLLRQIEAALEPEVHGVFNVSGTEPVPLSHILRILGKPLLPIPASMFHYFLGKAWKYRLTTFPAPELDHIQYPCVLDTARAEREIKARPERDLYEILDPFRAEKLSYD